MPGGHPTIGRDGRGRDIAWWDRVSRQAVILIGRKPGQSYGGSSQKTDDDPSARSVQDELRNKRSKRTSPLKGSFKSPRFTLIRVNTAAGTASVRA